MNPATPVLVTIALVIPFLILAMYFHRHIHLARRPDVARLKVLRWARLFLILLMAACAALQIFCFMDHARLHLATASLLVWPLLAGLAAGLWWQIRQVQTRLKKPSPYPVPQSTPVATPVATRPAARTGSGSPR